MIVVYQNLDKSIRDLDGRLLPFGWWKLLWHLKVAFPQTARVPLMGVRKRYQGSALGIALAFLLIERVRSHGLVRGVQDVRLSWILEDNMPMRNILAVLGSIPYKCYRIYERTL